VVIIVRIAPQINHDINRTAAAQNFATGTKDFAVIQVGFWFREIAPVHLRA
jgi:hypothetical protein